MILSADSVPGFVNYDSMEKNIWIEEGKVFDVVSTEKWEGGYIHLSNCVVGSLILMGGYSEHLVIENCIVKIYDSVGVHFNGKVIIRNSIFLEKFHFTDGGHNKEEVIIENNVFNCFADFFDEYFIAKFIMKNNVFNDGTNLLAYKGASYEVMFKEGCEIENNIGRLDDEG